MWLWLGILLVFVTVSSLVLALKFRHQWQAAIHELKALNIKHQLEIQQKNNFLATASHDLQQPHQALGLFLASIHTDTLSEHNSHIIHKAKDAHQATARLLSHLLDLSQLDNMAQKPHFEVIPLHDFIHDLGMRFMPLATEHQIELRIRVQEAYALSNTTMLERMLNNMLLNALHHAQCTAVLLAIRQNKKDGKQAWCLEIYDNGKGIPQDKKDIVFNEFTQLHQPKHAQANHLGLGLSIVRRLSHILNHPVILRSRLGHGSCFSTHLPAITASATNPRPQHDADSDLPQGLNVAIIINNAIIRDSLTQLIASWGCHVQAFSSLTSMQQHTASAQPDAFIMDDTQAVHQATSNINRILITQDSTTAYAKKAQDLGFSLLADPIHPRMLKALLNPPKR